MLGQYWVEDREPLVNEMEDKSAYLALCKGYDVVIDASHIPVESVNRWRTFVNFVAARENIEVSFAVKDLTDVPFQECLDRNDKRTEGKVSSVSMLEMRDMLSLQSDVKFSESEQYIEQ